MRKLFTTLFLFVCLSANAVEKKTNFSEEVFEKAKASGKTVVVNSYEVWCGTCSKQTKILDQAEKEFKDIVFLSYEQSKNKNIVVNNFFITCYNIFLCGYKYGKPLFFQPAPS